MDSALPTTQPKLPIPAHPPLHSNHTENRTGKSYGTPLTHATIRAMDLRQIKVHPEDFGIISYDPA